MERSVKRTELHSAESTPPSTPDPERLEKLKHLGELEYLNNVVTPDDVGQSSMAEEDQMDFQLFAPSNPTITAQKIRLRSPTPAASNSGFIEAKRHPSYYFTSYTDDDKTAFHASALSASQIMSLSKLPSPGLAYPWKVLRLSLPSTTRLAQVQDAKLFSRLVDDTVSTTRTRPGKKSRIKRRSKLVAARLEADEARKAAQVKEAAERVNRTEKNRAKKVKRKAREKAKKAEALSDD